MKKLYRRSISGLMALLICFTTILGGCITAFAASSSGEVAKSYSIGFPRSGDANLDYSGTWGHDELHYMNGWTSGEATWMTTLHTIGSFDGPACYCIEPGVPRLLEKTYTSATSAHSGLAGSCRGRCPHRACSAPFACWGRIPQSPQTSPSARSCKTLLSKSTPIMRYHLSSFECLAPADSALQENVLHSVLQIEVPSSLFLQS